MKQAQQKKGLILLNSLVAIILSAILLVAGINILFKFLGADQTHEDLLERFSNDIKKLDSQPQGSVERVTFRSNPEEQFLFFSTGQSDITLSSGGSTFVFTRPKVDACKNQACICYCKQGLPWSKKDEKPYVKLNTFVFENNVTYTCLQPQCVSGTHISPLYFGNSRGKDDSFTQDALELAEQRNSKKGAKVEEQFSAISMDIPIIIQGLWRGALPGKDPFFKKFGGHDYHAKKQDKKFLEYVLDHQWSGGVVLGGSGFAPKSKSAYVDMQGPLFNVVLEKSDVANVIGVCLDSKEDCLRTNAQNEFQTTKARQEAYSQIHDLAHAIEVYAQQPLPKCFQQETDKQKCATQFKVNVLEPFFSFQSSYVTQRITFLYADPLLEQTTLYYSPTMRIPNIQKGGNITLPIPPPQLVFLDGTQEKFSGDIIGMKNGLFILSNHQNLFELVTTQIQIKGNDRYGIYFQETSTAAPSSSASLGTGSDTQPTTPVAATTGGSQYSPPLPPSNFN